MGTIPLWVRVEAVLEQTGDRLQERDHRITEMLSGGGWCCLGSATWRAGPLAPPVVI